MRKNELRVGNYVFDDYSGIMEIKYIALAEPRRQKSYYVIGLQHPGFNVIGSYNIKDINPIPLTEKWFFKVGARKVISDTSVWYLLPDSCIEIEYNNDKSNNNSGWILFDNEDMKAIRFVHQLQNLYQSLRQKDLIILKDDL